LLSSLKVQHAAIIGACWKNLRLSRAILTVHELTKLRGRRHSWQILHYINCRQTQIVR